MFPAAATPDGLEKFGTSHVLAENSAGKVGQNGNPESAREGGWKAGKGIYLWPD